MTTVVWWFGSRWSGITLTLAGLFWGSIATATPPAPTSLPSAALPTPESQNPQTQSEAFNSESSHPESSHPESPDLQNLDDSETSDSETDPLAQVRAVTELSDVQPGDWAYEALRSLIERYGLGMGYPDGTFRGDRSLSRAEFAALINQVLVQVQRQLSQQAQATQQLREDFATLRRLQASYSAITRSLTDRLNVLDSQSDRLTKQQFSTTTKLAGQTVLALTDGTNANTTILNRTRLNFNTSFSPNNLLVTQLEVGNNSGDAVSRLHDRRQNLLGTVGLLADGGGADYVRVADGVRLSKLYYSFQPIDRLNITVGARLAPRDFIDYNRFANESTQNFSSSFFSNNPLIVQNAIDRPGGAGVVLTWRPLDLPLTLRGLYVAADANQPNSALDTGGLFGDRNQTSLEAEYSFGANLVARLQYTAATVNNTTISAIGLNTEWAINPQFGIFGRLGFGHYEGSNPFLNRRLDLNPWTWAVGVVLRRVVIPGSTAGLAIGQPFVEDDLGTATQTNVELFYNFLLNDNISFSPSLLMVSHPNNDRTNRTVWEWIVRMVYSF